MHNIFDLNEMDLEQIRAIADELGIHVGKKMEKKDIAYMILDKEAALNAQNAPEKPKRGRPKKQKTQEASTVSAGENEARQQDENAGSKGETRHDDSMLSIDGERGGHGDHRNVGQQGQAEDRQVVDQHRPAQVQDLIEKTGFRFHQYSLTFPS